MSYKMLIMILIILLFNFLSVGFYTLIEQKILGYMNNRLGPNKIFFLGLIQFIMDFIKLLFKDNIYLLMFNFFNYYMFIYLFFIISLMFWILFPLVLNLFNMKFMLIFFLLLMINKIFLFMLLIWSFNSIYSIISLIRMVIQNLSFEILFFMLLFLFIFISKNISMIFLNKLFNLSIFFFYSLLIFYLWILVMLIELNRIPFDFLESESELISGMNLEFCSINFLFLFLIEYLDMIFFSVISIMIFLNLNMFNMNFYIILMFFLLMLLFFRGFLVRFRIDKLLLMLWKYFFPLLMNYFIFMFYLKFFYMYIIYLSFKLKLKLLV